MAVATTVNCQSCGTKNDATLDRCRICTRQLSTEDPVQAAFEDDLYSRPVRAKKLKFGEMHPVAIVLAFAAIALMVNYQFLGYGPSWAHRPETVVPGSSWRPYDGSDWSASLPADGGSGAVPGPTGSTERAWAGVDESWDTVAGGGALSPASAARAESDLIATVVVTAAAAPQDLSGSADAMVAAALPGTTLSNVSVRQIARPEYGEQINVVANFNGGLPSGGGSGSVVARLISIGDRAYVVATFTKNGTEADIQNKMLTSFRTSAGR